MVSKNVCTDGVYINNRDEVFAVKGVSSKSVTYIFQSNVFTISKPDWYKLKLKQIHANAFMNLFPYRYLTKTVNRKELKSVLDDICSDWFMDYFSTEYFQSFDEDEYFQSFDENDHARFCVGFRRESDALLFILRYS